MENTLKGGKLGREIKISPKAVVFINPPFKKEFFTDTIEMIIGIGKNHTASLTMDVDAWEALKNGEEINITLAKKFRKQFL